MGFDLKGGQNTKPADERPRSDVIFQEFKLYIEGVQIPFMSINVQSSLGQLPRMNIQVPSQSGLMEICRYYEPKVHLFFKDPVTGEDAVLFTGTIVSTSYYKSTQSPGQKMISFRCEHKYAKMDMITMDYSGISQDTNQSITDPNPNGAAVKTNMFNSLQSIGMALTGVDVNKVGGSEEISIANVKAGGKAFNSIPQYLDDIKYRLTGFPGVVLNLWNQLKEQVYRNPEMFEGMTRMYIPMAEEGLQFFKRMGGHFLVEELLSNAKSEPCTKDSTGENVLETDPRLIPPAYQSLMRSAIQSDISTQQIYASGQFSGEFTSFLKILQELMYSIEYDMIFMASPAEVPKDPRAVSAGVDTYAMDVIVKPQMPHYYSPACNIVLPYMLDTLTVNQDEQSVPTRITAVNDNVPQSSGQFGTHYRAPQSVREAVARGVAEIGGDSNHYASLLATMAAAQYKVGKYEQGRGIKHQKIQLPRWLAILAESMSAATPNASEEVPASDSTAGQEVDKFRRAWQYRNDPEEKMRQLNPWDPSSEVNGYHRLLFSAADYKFTTEAAQARTGTVTMIFNPYLVAGYPMDIIDPTPTEPSFHAFCVDVNHSITARSISTQASFVSAMSYQELGNYEQQYTHPWLQSVTKLVSEEADSSGKPIFKTSIVNNVNAREAASEFYLSTLGVGAAAPEFLYNFGSGTPYPFTRVDGVPTDRSEQSSTMHVSGEGNLGLIFRPIETQAQHAERFGIKFVDMSPENYNSEAFSYKEPILDEPKLLEPGQSMFLDYADQLAPSRDENSFTGG